MNFSKAIHISEIPRECVIACSNGGGDFTMLQFWRDKIDFRVDRESAVEYLKSELCWYDEVMKDETDETLSCRILCAAVGEFREYINACETKGLNPYDPQIHYEPATGSNMFVFAKG